MSENWKHYIDIMSQLLSTYVQISDDYIDFDKVIIIKL